MVSVVLTCEDLVLGELQKGVQERMASYCLSVHLNLLNQPAFVPLLDIDSEMVGYKLMTKADSLDLQMLTVLIGRLEIPHSFLDTMMLLIDRSGATREHNHIQFLYFLDSGYLVLREFCDLIEEPFFVVVE